MSTAPENSDSSDARKYPLIPIALAMALTSFSPAGIFANPSSPFVGNCSDSVATSVSRQGFSLFLEDIERAKKKQVKVGQLALSRGVDLPVSISHLPDETLKFLERIHITPDFINSSQEDSLIIEFTVNENYHLIEFFSDGEIVLLKKGNNGTDAWDLTSSNYFDKLKQELLIEQETEDVE